MVDAPTPMAGRVVLITGGTGGIGKATAIGLSALGARVAITGRDLARAESAASDIRRATGNPAVGAFAAELSSQAEVRRLAAAILGAYPRLDVLVNNVGGSWNTRHVTADGLERTFAVNHLAAFLLTNLLMDRLKASTPARVVTVSSAAQSSGTIDFDDLQGERDYSERKAYPQSKLASLMFTYELARRLEGTHVTANVLHPGVVSTSFGAEDPGLIFRVLVPFMRPFMKTPAKGAATSIFLASSPEAPGVRTLPGHPALSERLRAPTGVIGRPRAGRSTGQPRAHELSARRVGARSALSRVAVWATPPPPVDAPFVELHERQSTAVLAMSNGAPPAASGTT